MVDVLRCSSQFIHIECSPNRGASLHCTFVYGSSEKQGRLQLFRDLQEISKTINSPWIILGDFNYVANFDERHGQPVRFHEIKPFRDCLDWCGVHDLHYGGRFFTWSNKQAGQSRVMSKIDRVLGNDLWEEAFPTVTVIFLPEGLFDHSPMVVSFTKIVGGVGRSRLGSLTFGQLKLIF